MSTFEHIAKSGQILIQEFCYQPIETPTPKSALTTRAAFLIAGRNDTHGEFQGRKENFRDAILN
jgi:hypothetical protein